MKNLLWGSLILANFAFGVGIPEELILAAQKEGRVDSVGMPDTWANWVQTWRDLKDKYQIDHTDTDMSSGEEINKFKSEGKNASADIGDVGAGFGDIAVAQGVTQPYKTSYWDDVPEWAKDKEGNWMLAYTGTIAFIVDKNQVKNTPKSWKELKESPYKVTVGDVGVAAQANNAVLSASFANGGDETNLEPGYEYFAEIARQGRLSKGSGSKAALEKGEVQVGIYWDFNALNYASHIDRDRFEIVIPSDGAVISGYTTIINKYAKHPNAAKLAREYIFSDEGQINLARGFARPIRKSVNLPQDVKNLLLPEEMYANARPIKNFEAWEQVAKTIGRDWQKKVLSQAK